MSQLKINLQQLETALTNHAESILKEQGSSPGRPQSEVRLQFAIKLAEALLNIMGIEPDNSQKGPFCRCFKLALEEVGLSIANPYPVLNKALSF